MYKISATEKKKDDRILVIDSLVNVCLRKHLLNGVSKTGERGDKEDVREQTPLCIPTFLVSLSTGYQHCFLPHGPLGWQTHAHIFVTA